WAPDGSMAVSGNQAGELILWQEAKAVATAQAPGHIGALIWSSARTFFVLSADEKISEWQVKLQKGSAPGNLSLHLNRILQEDLGVLTSLGWAPDRHFLILAKADLTLLCMKPGDAPSEIWNSYTENPMILSTHKEYGIFVLQPKDPGVLYLLTQNESGEFEERLNFDINLENPSRTLISITQAKPESALMGCYGTWPNVAQKENGPQVTSGRKKQTLQKPKFQGQTHLPAGNLMPA
ncbi:TEP1 isoform 10, partial [Pongo abelii]